MNCTDCRDLIHSHLDDELEEQLLTEVVSHLASCSECNQELGVFGFGGRHNERGQVGACELGERGGKM